MGSIDPTLRAYDVKLALLQIHLLPLQARQFRHTQRMAERDQDQGSVAMPVPTYFAGSAHQLLDLLGCEVFARSDVLVPGLLRHLSRKRWLVKVDDLG